MLHVASCTVKLIAPKPRGNQVFRVHGIGKLELYLHPAPSKTWFDGRSSVCSRIHEFRPAPTGAVFHTHQTAAAALSALEIDE